jgi:hypothetical protein
MQPSGWRSVFGCHWAAEVFPALSAPELRALGEDIREHGLITPIKLILIDGEPCVLDGRQRLDSMELVGLPVIVDDDLAPGIPCELVGALPGFDPVAYVISLGLRHRHLTPGQASLVAAKLINDPFSKKRTPGRITAGDAAELMNVSIQGVGRAVGVLKTGVPELVAAVEAGEVKVRPAAKIAALPPAEQLAALAAGDTKEKAKPKPDKPAHLAPIKRAIERREPGRVSRPLPRVDTEDIRNFIDSLMLRREEMAAIPKTERIALARAFAVALQLVEPAEQASANPSSWPI